MSGDRLIGLLTEIRDQQRQQVDNFQQTLQAQMEYADLQRKSRRTFLFLIYAPWIAMAFMLLHTLLPL